MKRLLHTILGPLTLACAMNSSQVWAQGTAFTYQGRLNTNGLPASGLQDFEFRVFSEATNGYQVSYLVSREDVPLSNGLFTVTLDFGQAFDGSDRWLEIAVRPGTSIGAFTTLAPRQKLMPTPYAMVAGAVANGRVFSSSIADGTIAPDDLSPDVLNRFWQVLSSPFSAGAPILGTTSNAAVEVHLNGQRALRLEPQFNGLTVSGPNIIAGGWLNTVSTGVYAATIAGGGINNGFSKNEVTGFAGTVGGGVGNTSFEYATVGGGNGNKSIGQAAFIGGGIINQVTSYRGVVVGGGANSCEGQESFIGGGYGNTNSGTWSSVLGGVYNLASGSYATVAGGRFNSASGETSFAAGTGAKALHLGSFVWADAQNLNDFASTANHQFLVRASGGMGVGTASPQGALHVYSANNPTVVRVQSAGAPGFGRIEFVSDPQGSASEWRPGYIQSTDNGGFTGGLSFVVNGTGSDSRFGQVETMRLVNGRVGIGNSAPGTLLQVGGATCNGTTWNNASDRNLKGNLAPVDTRDVLAKVAALPIQSWSYTNDATVRHVGPMAQDFQAFFGLGEDDRHIATVDADGVALAAIQGLNQKLEEQLRHKDAELQSQQRQIGVLLERLAAIEAKLQGPETK